MIDKLQFAYQPKSVNDAVLTLVHEIAQHIDKLGCFARALFADFSSAFNTMQTHVLLDKLHQMNVPPYLILWIKDFLSDRTQRVKVQNCLSDPVSLDTGAPPPPPKDVSFPLYCLFYTQMTVELLWTTSQCSNTRMIP